MLAFATNRRGFLRSTAATWVGLVLPGGATIATRPAPALVSAATAVSAATTYNVAIMASVQFSSTQGQSLAQNNQGGTNETLVQEYLAKAFPPGKTTTTFGDLVPAIATDLTLSSTSTPRLDSEQPLFGILGFGYAMGNTLLNIAALHRIGISNGAGASAIAQQQKPNTPFTSTIAGLNAAKNYATSIGKSTFDMGFLWAGGESNTGDSKATYLAALTQLAYDHATDRKAITGQTLDPAMFTYITSSNPQNTGTRSGVARAQHQAAIDYFNGVIPAGKLAPVPIILATPMHFMSTQFDGEGLHVPASWAYLLGAYVALAQFHCYMKYSTDALNLRWRPIHPTAVDIVGGQATITYAMRTTGTALEFGVSDRPNGQGMALQQDYGFAVLKGGVLLPIATPTIIGTNQVRITLSTGTFADGDRIGYALDRPVDKHLYAGNSGSSGGGVPDGGGAGNLRDNYGNTVRCAKVNMPMHNWVGPIDINIGAANTWSIS